jgi:hypothetical protein
MNTHKLLGIAIAALCVPGVAVAQHEAHQAAAGQASPEMGQCARAQPVIANIIAAATARLESARQSNNPAEMRAAVDQLEAALRDIRTQLAPCAALAAAAEPQGGHSMPGMQQPPAAAGPEAPTCACLRRRTSRMASCSGSRLQSRRRRSRQRFGWRRTHWL